MKRPPKKDVTLEVRLPQETKRAFMERCKAEGSTASDTVRGFIETHLARPLKTQEQPSMRFRQPASLAAVGAFAAFAAVGVALFAPTASSAAPDLKAMFEQLDADKDGKVTAAEFAAPRDLMFKSADEPARAGEPPTKLFIAMAPLRTTAPMGSATPPSDTPPPAPPPGMVALSEEERTAMYARRFAELDADKNAIVTFDEFAAHHRAMLARAFKSMDANQDGKLTQAEMDAPPPLPPSASYKAGVRVAFRGKPGEDTFAKLDKNKDGALTEAEFADMP